MKSCKFIDNKWLTAIEVVYISGMGEKPRNGQFKSFETVNFKTHQKKSLRGSIK